MGLRDQVTAVLVVPLTVAMNCEVCAHVKVALRGLIVTVIGGTRAIEALADFVESAALVAVTVTGCEEVIVAGAV